MSYESDSRPIVVDTTFFVLARETSVFYTLQPTPLFIGYSLSTVFLLYNCCETTALPGCEM